MQRPVLELGWIYVGGLLREAISNGCGLKLFPGRYISFGISVLAPDFLGSGAAVLRKFSAPPRASNKEKIYIVDIKKKIQVVCCRLICFFFFCKV